MPKKDNSGVVPLFIAPGVCGSGGGSDHGASTRGDCRQSRATSRHRGSQPPNGGTMAAVVVGRVCAEFVLEMGVRTVGPAGGPPLPAVIAAGVVSEATARGKNRGPAALHPASDNKLGDARNLRVAWCPAEDAGRFRQERLIGFAVGGQKADSEPAWKEANADVR